MRARAGRDVSGRRPPRLSELEVGRPAIVPDAARGRTALAPGRHVGGRVMPLALPREGMAQVGAGEFAILAWTVASTTAMLSANGNAPVRRRGHHTHPAAQAMFRRARLSRLTTDGASPPRRRRPAGGREPCGA